MASEIRANSITSRAGLSTVTLTDSGPMFSGITTFVDNSTFSVGTGGTIHAPATNTLNIGVNNTESLRIDSNSNLKVAGIVTATHFYGSGANLTGITALSGSTNDTVCTVTGANAIQGEANLTFNSSNILTATETGTGNGMGGIRAATANAGGNAGYGFMTNSANRFAVTTIGSAGAESLRVYDDNNNAERLRIDSSGRLLVGGTGNTESDIRLYLHNSGAAGSQLQFTGNASGTGNSDGFRVGYNGSGGQLWLFENQFVRIATNNAERLRINSDGTVTIGQVDVSSSSALHIRSITSAETTLELSTKDNYNGSLPSAKISFTQQNGTEIARIKCDTNTGAANMADLTFWTNYGGLAERMRIKKTGEVGINQTSPRRPLDIIGNDGASGASSGNSDTTIILDNAGGNGSMIEFLNANNSAGHLMFTDPEAPNQGRISYHHSGDYFRFDASGNEMMRLYGDVFRIGNSLGTAAAGRFQVVEERGGNRSNDCNAYFETNAADWNIKTYYNTSGAHYHMSFVEQGSDRGYISGSDGSNVTYQSGSDYRWKENVVEMTGTEGIDICKKLKPSKYNWIENREATGQVNTVDGFIAHEVVEAGVLGAVSGEKDAVNEDGSVKGQMLDYGQITPVLAAAIKGLITKVETLEQDNITLRARVTNLEGN